MLREQHGDINGVAWSPDNSRLAATTQDGTVVLWDAAGTKLAELAGHRSWARGVAWSPDGRLLATSGADFTVRLWDGRQHTELAVLEKHRGQVWSVAWSPDGTRVVSGGGGPRDYQLRIWAVR